MVNSRAPRPRAGVVSVILVNFRGIDDTLTAIAALREISWPAESLEIVVVDNASGDDSVARLRAEAGRIVLVESAENLGFAGGCNLGARRASGEYLAFLNNDARPDENWIAAAVAAFEDPAVGAVASQVRDWEGERVDFIDAAMTWFGMGYKPLVGQPIAELGGAAKDVLFGTGSAMFVRASVYAELGGFDESYFMFFEDVDLGWRLNLLGHRYRYVPESLAYHRHHASADRFAAYRETYFLERNALATLYKNLGDEQLARRLPAALGLAVRRSVAKGGVDSESYDYRRPLVDSDRTDTVSRDMLAGVYAVDQFVALLPQLTAARDDIQTRRVRTDRDIWTLLGEQDAPSYDGPAFLDGYEDLVHAFEPLEEPRATRVLVITGDPIGKRIAGPAIRAWNIALALADEGHDVVLATMESLEKSDAPFRLTTIGPGEHKRFAQLEAWCDVVLFQGNAMRIFEELQVTSKIVIADVYDPMHLEQLEQAREQSPRDWDIQVAYATDSMNEQLARGDFFLCSSERQRHFYLGQLAALGRLSPTTYENDENLTGMLAVVPFGLSATDPVHERDAVKGVVPGIGVDDKLILWGGGLYNWFDPGTLIRAVADLAERHSDVRLLFLGARHPHPGVPVMRIVQESFDLARELGVLGTHVFFSESWVDFDDRQNYLLEADLGVSTHYDHLETTFAFRTRILDYLWAGIPMVVTEGDSFADLVRDEGLGIAVPATDAGALSAALETMLYDADAVARARANVARVRVGFRWSEVLKPLLEFMRAPRRSADAEHVRAVHPLHWAGARRPARRHKPWGARHNLERVVFYLRRGGPKVVFEKVARRITRRRG